MKAIAFSPAHITGVFEICYGEDEVSTGSRGAGFSISLGSYAEARYGEGVILEGNIGEGEITREALRLLGVENIKLKITNQMPLSQGFGMSSSSTLAAPLAACRIFSISPRKAMEASHVAEVKLGGGLGDVVASFHGGMEIRISPGLHGKIEKRESREKVLVAVVGRPIKTGKIIGDEIMMERINDEGREAMKRFLKNPSLENLAEVARDFALSTGIANEKMRKIFREGNEIGSMGMCMLGNSVFAPYSKKMHKFLSKFQCYECFIDNEGARVLATFFP